MTAAACTQGKKNFMLSIGYIRKIVVKAQILKIHDFFTTKVMEYMRNLTNDVTHNALTVTCILHL